MQEILTIPELAEFVEKDTELPKGTLLARIAGPLKESLVQFIRMLPFHHAIKTKEGNVILV